MRPSGVPALLALLLLAAPASALERYPTAHRFGISLGFGFGSAALSSFHEGVDDLQKFAGAQGVVLQSPPKSGLQINAEIGFRYYFPYYVLAQVGYGSVYNWAGASFGPGEVKSHQLAMDVPVLVGGYYPFLGRLWVFGAVGPSPFFYVRSFWDIEPAGSMTDFKADGGVGFHALAGAEFLVARSLAVGLELRYRYLKSGDLRELETGTVITQHMFLGNGSSRTYDLDLSGISLGLTIRAFAF